MQVINNRSAQLFKDFQKISPDEAYRLFCLTELLEARKYGQKINTVDAWTDYRERRCFHFLQCQFEVGRTSALPTAVKQKQKLQKAHALHAHKMAAFPTAPAKPTKSRAKKPAIGRSP